MRPISRFPSLILAVSILTASAAHAALVISNAATKNVNCSSSVCTATAKNAVLNVAQLQGLLAASDMTVNTSAGAQTIGVSAPLTWASTSRLTLKASQGVAIKAAVVVEGTGAITIAASGDAVNFYPGGSISFWDDTSSLIIGGQSYTLVSDLATLASKVSANSSGFYALAKNYDASGDSYSDSPVRTTLDGTFEGLGNTISNLSLNVFDPIVVGLFSEIDGTVRNLSLQASMECDPADNTADEAGLLAGENRGQLRNITVSGFVDCVRAFDVGGVVGDNLAPGIVSHVTANVAVLSERMHTVGGLVGVNTGTIQFSSASGNVEGADAGGLVGKTTGMVQDSHASGRVNFNTTAGQDAGGLAGSAQGTVLRSFGTGNVNAKSYAGGLVGFANSLTVDQSFATGIATSGRRQAGGLIGYANGFVTVTNSYARGAANGGPGTVGYAGGLAGWFKVSGFSVTASYSTGAPSAGQFVGGSIGDIGNTATMTNVYWDLDTSGVSDPSKAVGNHANFPGIAGLNDTALKSALPSGFDPGIWGQSAGVNDGYPYLLSNPPQ